MYNPRGDVFVKLLPAYSIKWNFMIKYNPTYHYKRIRAVLPQRVRGPGFDIRSGNILSFLLPLFSKRAVVGYWRKYVHEVLVNRLGGLSLPKKNVVRLTDRPDMTLDVYRGRKKSTIQHLTVKLLSVVKGISGQTVQSIQPLISIYTKRSLFWICTIYHSICIV